MAMKKSGYAYDVAHDDDIPAPPRYPGPQEPVRDTKVQDTDLKNWRQRFAGNIKIHKRRYRKVLVEMTLRTGKVWYMTASLDEDRFVWRGRTYVPDPDTARHCANLNLSLFRFHEDFAVSLAWDVDATSLKAKAREMSPDITTSFSPDVLRGVLKNEYTKAVVQGAEVSAMMKRTFIVVLVALGVALLHLGVHAYKAGWIG